MADDFFAALGEFGVHVGMRLIGKALEPSREINKTELANAILECSVYQATEIVTKLGIGRQLDDDRGDFGVIVGVIARELISLTDLLTDVKISLKADCSLDLGEVCMRGMIASKG